MTAYSIWFTLHKHIALFFWAFICDFPSKMLRVKIEQRLFSNDFSSQISDFEEKAQLTWGFLWNSIKNLRIEIKNNAVFLMIFYHPLCESWRPENNKAFLMTFHHTFCQRKPGQLFLSLSSPHISRELKSQKTRRWSRKQSCQIWDAARIPTTASELFAMGLCGGISGVPAGVSVA